MKARKLWKKLDKTLLFLVVLVFIMAAATFWKGRWELTILGLTQAGQLIHTVWLRLLLGLTLGGLIQVLIPGALIAKWLGHTSGLKGILIGSYIGVILPGGPYINLPIIASIYRSGAGVGPIIALLTGRAMLGLQILLVWQIPFLGLEIPLARYIACLIFPPIAGLAGRAVFALIGGALPPVTDSDPSVYGVEHQRDEAKNTYSTSEKKLKGDKWT